MTMRVNRSTLARAALAAAVLSSTLGAKSRSGGEWTTVGGDSSNTRYSPLAQINTGNVKRLGGAWQIDLPGDTRTPPVIAGGRLFTMDYTTIYAIDPRSGAVLWRYTPKSGTPARGGVAVGEGLVFCGLTDTHLIALKQATGELVWRSYIGNVPEESAAGGERMSAPGLLEFSPKVGLISNAPTYINGVVASGVSGGDGGARGKIAGVEAGTGRVIWSFYVIPAAGEAGSETWPLDGEAMKAGGGAVWTQGAADPDLDLIYYGTGNAVPVAAGELRPGDNLYTASVVALDAKSGALHWHFQLTHHDLWEMDASIPVVLFTAKEHGRRRKALATVRTDGYLFILDRATGEPVFPVEERPVKQDIRLHTSPTQPYPVGADQFGPNCVEKENAPEGFELGCYFDPMYFDRPNVLTPLLTTRFAPLSYDAGNGYIYVMGNVTPTWYRRVANPNALVASNPPGAKEYGIYAAIDTTTNKVVWQKRSPWELARGSGALTTAGGLLFHMEGDGTVQASNAKTGEVLWQFQTGSLGVGPHSLSGGVPFATYEMDHEQYIAVPMGKALWAFKLNGSLPPKPAAPAPPSSFGFTGIVKTLPADGSGEIRIGTLAMSYLGPSGGYFPDEYAFVPLRARVKAGQAFKWTNYGVLTHSIVAADGSWSTGPVLPTQSVILSIARPGTYVFFAQEFPWAKGQLIVQ